ncbi:MAG: nickel pincer cofactor biosynthesis protein LarC [Lachnospiraceae bacterium]|nr:nickel pincer cofactor biosynthesis protein LarC [Lachnospiraceae bacterium]
MEQTLYLECESGISGDMSVAAMLDLGADQEVLKKALMSLPLTGYEIAITRVDKSGLSCMDFNVVLEEDNHDHDMEYLHGHDHEHHDHEHHHHDHHHSHRHLREIEEIIDGGNLTEGANALAKKIFYVIAKAEAKAHGKSIDEVGFHEVGAVDSIVDIVAFAVCFDNLNINKVIIPKICEGNGTVRCQHGILPIPVPAVANIMSDSEIPMEMIPVKGEFITPTGAAIAKAIATDFKLPKTMKVKKMGLGAGKRSYERASILRAFVIEEESGEEDIVKLETNIDDCSGENLGYVMECLLNAGARDVHYMPCFMKKNRPGYMLSVICSRKDREALERIMFRETTTIGIRCFEMERSTLERHIEEMDTKYGKVKVKVCEQDGAKRYYPEYEDVAKICREKDLPFTKVYHEILKVEK